MYAVNTSAAEFRFMKEGGNITVSQDETVKNLYTAGNMVSIDSNVEKSLYIAGNIITINGNVENNIFTVGNTVVIRGNVGDSVHLGASGVVIEGDINGDLFMGGGNIIISKSASIGGDVIVGGGTVDIQGPVAGNVRLGGGQATINNKIGGDVNAKVDKITFGSQAEISGKVLYESTKEATIEEGALLLGGIEFNEIKVKKVDKENAMGLFFLIFSLGFLIKLLGVIVVGLVLIYFLKDFIGKIVNDGLNNFWANIGRGFAILILTPITCFLLLITIIGIWLAGLIWTAYVLALILALALASIILGSWLMKVLKKESEYKIDWKAVVLGAIALRLFVLIPFIGWFIGLVFMLIGLGVISKLIYQGVIKK